MGAITDLRSFINSKVEELDSSFTEFKGAFDLDNVPFQTGKQYYHVDFGEYIPGKSDKVFLDLSSVTIRIWGQDDRDSQNVHDSTYDLAVDLRRCLGDLKNANQEFIKDVNCTGIIPSPVGNNANAVALSLNFNFTLAFKAF